MQFIYTFSEVISHVETATEAKEPPPPDVTSLCRETFHKTGEYLSGELACEFSGENDVNIVDMMSHVIQSCCEKKKM